MTSFIIKSTKSIAIGMVAFCYVGFNAQTNTNFSGKYSSEGETTAKGTSTMEISQTGAKIEGVFNYLSYDDGSDSGILSVNGYAKGDIGYLRFRDQRGNTVGDGSINFQNSTTLHFKQTTKSSLLPIETWMFSQQNSNKVPTATRPTTSPQTIKSFTGKYSNEGDVTAKGIVSFEITQSGTKIEGTSTYQAFDDSLNSGLLSVNGYVKDGIAYIRFRDQKGNPVADGALHYEGKNIVFRQTTLSDIVPHYAVLYR
ncbi:hypothetical protein [Elizabethkingia sp. JS20170427COW]|uniref:hypothetical protein n=1 Tax=Elizabethkingia sp. JS20170427COW TaxID=2583851 RepID=UPI0021078F41|nr:hypothetical protein [Elizabethkingia sp. JS20170427COW]